MKRSTKSYSFQPRATRDLLIALVLTGCALRGLHAQVVVAPNALVTTDGNSSTTSSPGPSPGLRDMQIFDASEFSALSGPSFLTQYAWRADATAGPAGPASAMVRIYASTTRRSVAEMSTTFADNLGTNTTLIFEGPSSIVTKNLPGPGNTRQFDIVFPLMTPFLYDPAEGNLVIDLQNSAGDGLAIRFDSVSGNAAAGSVVGFGSARPATGQRGSPAVTQFTFEPPPQTAIRASQMQVCWNSMSNLLYQVQYRSDLTTNLWTALLGCIRSTNSTTCIFDPVIVGQPQKFYRVIPAACDP